jgi:hypothetical protein
MLVSNSSDDKGMVQGNQFRRVLLVSQTALAVFFGAWGLWLRNSVLSRPWLGGSTGWDSTLRFHVWPWPFKFAAILNMPAFLAGSILSWPLDYIRPGLPEWVSFLPELLFVPLLWYWVGSLPDKGVNSDGSRDSRWGRWILLLLFTVGCAAAASASENVGGHTSYLEFGIAIWLIAAIGAKGFAALRRRKSKVA